MKILDNPEYERRVIALLNNTQTPVSTDYVAYHLSVNWTTARSLLLSMSLNGQIGAVRTTRGFIFYSVDKEAREPSAVHGAL